MKNTEYEKLINKRFGFVTVLSISKVNIMSNGKKSPFYKVLCQCGKVYELSKCSILQNKSNCGCIDLLRCQDPEIDFEKIKIVPDEEWKQVNGHEGRYYISSEGRLITIPPIIYCNGRPKRKKWKFIKPSISGGYLSVGLWKSSKIYTELLHRLVAIHFIPNPENKPEVNHLFGNKLDPRASKLEWCTERENMLHSYKTLKRKTHLTGKNGLRNYKSVPVKVVTPEGVTEYFESLRIACTKYNLISGSVSVAMRTLKGKHKKYHFSSNYNR